MKQKFATPYYQPDHGKNYQVFTMPSETIPDETMSVAQIMDRYARGLPLGGQKIPVYNDSEESEDMLNYERLDKIGKIEFQRAHQEKVKDMYDDLDKKEKEKQKKKFDDHIEGEVSRRLTQKEQIGRKTQINPQEPVPGPPGGPGGS